MSIWFKDFTLEDLNQRSENTLAEFIGIEFIEIGENYLTAVMPASERTKQPIGIVHGGANLVLAETVASTAANVVIDIDKYYCVGLEINANHIRPVSEGLIYATAKPAHLGKKTQVWIIDLYNDQGKPTCVSRMTASVISR